MTVSKAETLTDALCRAQSQMQAAKMDSQNPHFKNKYASLASVIDAVRKPLADNGLAVTQLIKLDRLVTRLQHSSGEFIESEYPLPPMASSQQYGSALTYARRYSLSAICCISADEDDDAEAIDHKRINQDVGVTAKALAKKDAKGIYEKLQGEMREQKSVAELKDWIKKAKDRIDILPDDWKDTLRLQCQEAIFEFRQGEEELEKYDHDTGELRK